MKEKLLPEFCQPSVFLISMCGCLVAAFCDVLHLQYWPCVFDPVSSVRKASELSTFFLPMSDVESLDLGRHPNLLLAQNKFYWAQKGAARLSSAQVRGSGVSPNSKQAYLLPQKHTGATGINMQ